MAPKQLLRSRLLVLCLAGIAMSTSFAFGQTTYEGPPIITSATTATFDLATTIQAALASSNDLRIAANNVQIDRDRADQAEAGARPNVDTSASATRFDQATVVALGGQKFQVLGPHTETLSASIGDNLDIAGEIRAASTQAKLQSLADQFTYNQIRNNRILQAETTYYNYLRAQHVVQVAQAALSTASTQLSIAQKLYAGQIGQKIDVYRASTQVSEAQQQLTAANNNRDIALADFNDLVGRPLGAPASLRDAPGVNVGVDVTGITKVGQAAPGAFTPYSVPDSDLANLDIDRSLQTAYASRPEVLAGLVNIRVAQTGVTLARAGLMPSLSIDAVGDYYPTTSFQSPRQRVASVTATLTLPLYDGGATRDLVSEAHLREQSAKDTLSGTREDVTLQVRQAYLNLLTAARQIDAANSALAQAVAARELAQARYTGQVGLYLEVTDAQSALVQAETGQVDAVYDYLVARAQFENSIGTPQVQ